MENGRTIGFIGDGQLARMMTIPAQELGFKVAVLDDHDSSPASKMGATQIRGNRYSPTDIYRFAEKVDVISFEIEHFATDPLVQLQQSGYEIQPSPSSVAIIQDKYHQKDSLSQLGVPMARFMKVDERKNIYEAGDEFEYPLVLKSRFGAFDGRGNSVIRNEDDVGKAWDSLVKPDQKNPGLYVEEYISFDKELAIMVARGKDNEIVTYPVVETVHKDNICVEVIAPASINRQTEINAKKLGIQVVESFEGQGVWGVEMFALKDGTTLLNEVAPRVHNSGHYTKEAAVTSQFEQHVRAAMGLPLGLTDMKVSAAVMRNILRLKSLDGLNDALKIPGVSVTIYGKEGQDDNRKLGHVVAVGSNMIEVIYNAREAEKLISTG